MSGYLYILKSETNGYYYIGSAVDPDRRLSQHNSNAVAATRGRGPWIRVALVSFASPEVAKKAELFIKRQKNQRIMESVVNNDFVWSAEFDR